MAKRAHPQIVEAVRRLRRDGWSYVALARLCGRAQDTVGRWCDPAVEKRKKERNAKRNKERREGDIAARKRWRLNNPDSVKESRERYKAKYPDRVKAGDKRYRQQNPEKLAAIQARRRASAPPWLTEDHLEEIESFYSCAKMMSEAFQVKYEVDHIHPTNGKTLCGLHVPWNLQILERSKNREKSNKTLVS